MAGSGKRESGGGSVEVEEVSKKGCGGTRMAIEAMNEERRGTMSVNVRKGVRQGSKEAGGGCVVEG